MGANIGTTVTGQILRLGDLENNANAGLIMQIVKPTTLAPMVSIVGIILLLMAGKNTMQKLVGETCLGFGILFQGMFAMEAAMEPLQQSETFRNVFASLQNPFLGVLAGAVVTGIIQSSSASIGILQALSSTGAITCSAAFPIIMGQNIGTCVTSLLSSIGANKNAKRAAMVHLYFNLIGTAIFLIGVYSINAAIGFSFWDDPITKGGIANFHTLFNVVTTCLLAPFYKGLAHLAEITVRESKKQPVEKAEISLATNPSEGEKNVLDPRFLSTPGLAIEQSHVVVHEMAQYALENFRLSYTLFRSYEPRIAQEIQKREHEIDVREDQLNNYLNHIGEGELTEPEQKDLTLLLRLILEFERIGDYAVNLLEKAEELSRAGVRFSDKALEELETICAAVERAVTMAADAFRDNDSVLAAKIEPLEETVDTMENLLKLRHIRRLKNGQCTIDAGLVFLEILTYIERVSDHCSNIAVYLIARKNGSKMLNRHEYITKMHKGETEDYKQQMQIFMDKYYNALPPEEA